MHPAHLQSNQLQLLQQWEEQLSQVSGQRIVLVAYSGSAQSSRAATSNLEHPTPQLPL
ncbi:hypothetical protein [Paenibacillus alvei]|jgi:hypothetical protein|uniref:hypothetical protein n=1 Tax=Paenibacillus alvei TaxID=44250 RepID=UPI0004074423|nr:hypothetical protein [Paenibacillus alvei]